MRVFLGFLLICFFTATVEAAVKFKGGKISSSSGNLKTEEPDLRPDLEFDLSKFQSGHLNKKISKLEAIRFERRIGIGAPLDRVSQWIGLTRQEAIERAIHQLENHTDRFKMPKWFDEMIPVSFIEDGLQRESHSCGIKTFRNSLEASWAKQIIETSTPQFERLALFWLDHFSVAFDTYNQTHSFAKHIEIVRNNSTGNFLNFLKSSFYDPGMIVYLNNDQSTVKNPNENLAREFFELFSLGEGKYSENDIKNLAKAISGHGINKVTEQFQIFNSKVSKGNFSGFGKQYTDIDSFMKLLSQHPSFGEFIARKFYFEYVELNEPSQKDLAYLVTTFRESGFEIPQLLKATLSLEQFWNPKNKLSLVKSPIELIFGTIRTLNTAGNSGQEFGWAISLADEFGQSLFNPPNIAGWPAGKEWLAGQALEKRLVKLPYYFEDLTSMDGKSVIKSQKSSQQDKRQKRAEEISEKYNRDLKNFFSDGSKEQFLAETMVINWIPDDFSTREYAEINVSFYNVSFNGKKWDGITVRFGTDVNAKKKQSWKSLDFISFSQGSSYPAAISDYNDGWISDWDGHRGWNSSFPRGPKERFRKKSKSDQLLMTRLLQSMIIPIENLGSFNALFRNKDAQIWLKEQIQRVGFDKIKTSKGKDYPVKIFSLLSNPTSSNIKKPKFMCNLTRTGETLASDKINFSSYLKENINLNHFIEGNKYPNLSQLLLPALNFPLSNMDALSLIEHEGYQLK